MFSDVKTTVSHSIAEFEEAYAQRLLDESIEDPVFQELKVGSKLAATRLREEIENFEEGTGASSSTRINASKAVLDFAGYKKDREGSNIVNIVLSEAKLDSVLSAKPPEDQPTDLIGARATDVELQAKP